MTCRMAIRGRYGIATTTAPWPESTGVIHHVRPTELHDVAPARGPDIPRSPTPRRIGRRLRGGIFGLLSGLLIGGILAGAAAAAEHRDGVHRLVATGLEDTRQRLAETPLSRAERALQQPAKTTT
jgi:hypothetical protein